MLVVPFDKLFIYKVVYLCVDNSRLWLLYVKLSIQSFSRLELGNSINLCHYQCQDSSLSLVYCRDIGFD